MEAHSAPKWRVSEVEKLVEGVEALVVLVQVAVELPKVILAIEVQGVLVVMVVWLAVLMAFGLEMA